MSPNQVSHAASPAHIRDAENDRFEAVLAAFEIEWRAGRIPSIDNAISNAGVFSEGLVSEFVLMDLEYRWRANTDAIPADDLLGARPTLRDYVRCLPRLGPIVQLSPELVAEEYRVRRLWGDRPTRDMFLTKYPEHLSALVRQLETIDQQLAADSTSRPSELPRAPAFVGIDPRAPLPFSDYLLESLLGAGGMGKVYRATQRSLGRRVAVKALLKSRQTDPYAIDQFLREGQILARLRHANIVGVRGLGRFPGGGYFLVMDLIEGLNLQSLLANGPFPADEAVRIVHGVADAVEHAHQHGVIHCDLKPANVLLDKDGRPVVTDFGLAQLIKSEAIVIGGTRGYMAPELTEEGVDLSPAVDVFGLGALLFALLTCAPYRPADLRLPSQLGRDIPPRLDVVCRRSLCADPGQRLQNVQEFLDAIGGRSFGFEIRTGL